MDGTVASHCKACILAFRAAESALASHPHTASSIDLESINDEFDRFSLWTGNIGAMKDAAASLSMETRLREEPNILSHILKSLRQLQVATQERRLFPLYSTMDADI